MMNPVEIIRRKRDGMRLETGEIEAFVSGAVNGVIARGQQIARAGGPVSAAALASEGRVPTGHIRRSRMPVINSSRPSGSLLKGTLTDTV